MVFMDKISLAISFHPKYSELPQQNYESIVSLSTNSQKPNCSYKRHFPIFVHLTSFPLLWAAIHVFFEEPPPPTLRACGLGILAPDAGVGKWLRPLPPWQNRLVQYRACDPSPSNLCLPTTSLNFFTTTPTPFSISNLGPFGRFLKENQHLQGGRPAKNCPQEQPVGAMASTMVTVACPAASPESGSVSAISTDWICREVTLHWD